MRDYGLSLGQQDELWRQWKQGEPIRSIARSVGAEQQHVRRFLAQSGGVRIQVRRRAAGHLTLHEREEISRNIAAGMSGRAIARWLNRPASTVTREISRNGGRASCRALDAEARAAHQARRPKPHVDGDRHGCGDPLYLGTGQPSGYEYTVRARFE